MPKHLEIERRFIARTVKLQPGIRGRQIVQGYFQTPAHATVRIRQTGGDVGTYELTRKTGRGRIRTECNSVLTDRTLGRTLLESCPFILRKRRFVRDGWEIDRYIGPLRGLWVLERELASADTPCLLPPWVNPATTVEVTNDLSNYDLAKLATALRGLENPPPIFELVTKPLPIVVITGGPCSGKSSILDKLRRESAQRIHVVPEAASIIINDVGIPYPAQNGLFVRQFQQQIYTVQQSFEFLARMRGRIAGQELIAVDRGSADSIAYLDGGTCEFERTCQTQLGYEYERYAAVICLKVPPRDVYEKYHASNPARRESYEDAVATGERTVAAWQGHPAFHYVDDEDWDAKCQHVAEILQSIIF